MQVLADEIPNTGKFNLGVDASAESQNELSDNDGYTIQVNGIAYTEPWNRIFHVQIKILDNKKTVALAQLSNGETKWKKHK